MRVAILLSVAILPACNPDIYTRDGVTDGDTFYLAPIAMASDDPALQSWVSYSLIKSTCQLQIGGENPGRNSSFACEFSARRNLVQAWDEKLADNQSFTDAYLDDLARVSDAGFLAEYTIHYFGKAGWTPPDGLRLEAFLTWKKRALRDHKPQTRLVGYWGHGKQ